MGHFLIDEPQHKRWMLPDGEHYYNSVIYGDWIYDTVWRKGKFGELDTCVISLPPIRIDEKGDWKMHTELAQELANKKFRAKQEKRVDDYMSSYRK